MLEIRKEHLFVAVVIWLSLFCLSGNAQQPVYRPKITVKAKSRDVKFNYGKGTFTCSKFLIETKRQNNNDILIVDINCKDSSANREISVSNNKNSGLYNIGSSLWPANNPSLPAVLVCEGGCNPSFTALRIGNLDATARNKGIVSNFGCGTINSQGCTGRPLEVKIVRQNGASAIFFRVGSWKRFEEARGLFEDKEDPGGPRAARYAGGQAAASGELAVEASN